MDKNFIDPMFGAFLGVKKNNYCLFSVSGSRRLCFWEPNWCRSIITCSRHSITLLKALRHKRNWDTGQHSLRNWERVWNILQCENFKLQICWKCLYGEKYSTRSPFPFLFLLISSSFSANFMDLSMYHMLSCSLCVFFFDSLADDKGLNDKNKNCGKLN